MTKNNILLTILKRSIKLILKVVLNPETTIPTENLLPETIEYLKSNGSNSTKITDIINNKDPIVYKLIEEGNYI
jgi:hypothetical protein